MTVYVTFVNVTGMPVLMNVSDSDCLSFRDEASILASTSSEPSDFESGVPVDAIPVQFLFVFPSVAQVAVVPYSAICMDVAFKGSAACFLRHIVL